MSAGRSPQELATVDDPAWPSLQAVFDAAGERVSVLPVEKRQGLDVLYRLQVTARSVLGALALNCGGALVDHGWLRLLGGGHHGLPDLARANHLGDPSAAPGRPGKLVVAYDVLGGMFAIDGGELGIEPGQVAYFGPDTLDWVGLGCGHGAFVAWACSPEVGDFYNDLRWPGWEQEVSGLGPGLGVSLYPPLFTKQGADPSASSRRPVPFAELLAFHRDMLRQLSGLTEGARFDVRISD